MKRNLKLLREQVTAFLDRWKARGRKTCFWKCDRCGNENETRQPNPDDVDDRGSWDSCTQCIDCGALNFVRVYPDGRAVTKAEQIATFNN
jgi:hypothetical protein